MECKACDSMKLFKVFDASRHKRNRKKRDGDCNSVASDDSESATHGDGITSAKGSLQDITAVRGTVVSTDLKSRDRDRSLSVSRSRGDNAKVSPARRHRRCPKEGLSLALKAGNPCSDTQDAVDTLESFSKDQDSSIYAYLEDALKREKKKQRHNRRQDCRSGREKDGGREGSCEREASRENGERRHRHRRRQEEEPTPDNEKSSKEKQPVTQQIDQSVILETFAKLCATLNEKTEQLNQLKRNLSHKSLQCETFSEHGSEIDHHPVKLRSHENSRENIPLSRTRTHANLGSSRVRSHEDISISNTRLNKKLGKCDCCPTYDNIRQRYTSKSDMRAKESESRFRDRPSERIYATYRSQVDRDCESRKDVERHYEDDRRRYVEAKTSRSFDVERPVYEDRRPTSRSDSIREKRYLDRSGKDLRKYETRSKEKYYEDKIDARERHFTGKERLSKRNIERFEKNSVVSREDSYRDKYSERERDSGLSVADDTSTVSGKSNYLRVVKREIADQREAMDKMMDLWKELMRCFKGISQTQKPNTSTYEKAETAHDSAAAQLRLWRECMRRYETVARDVGDTDARLMEEINKQRSEMAEMSTMFQECLQRYRDMSTEFDNLKHQVALASESPTRDTTPAPILPVNLEADPMQIPPNSHYRMPPNYANLVPPAPQSLPYPQSPPAWWWDRAKDERPRDRHRSPRRRSPESRGSRGPSRERRRPHRERTNSRTRNERYKEKSKPGAAKSEHRHKKR